jgi:drug/metabolite transporter (DMT)-like permease
LTAQLGILFALLSALVTNVGFLTKYKGACAAPPVEWRHPFRSAAGLWRQRWFAVGMLVAICAWAMHVAAMSLAPLSIVQAVIAGGLAFLAVLAERFLGCELGRRQWCGVALTSLGLALLAITLPHSGGTHSDYSLASMVAFEGGLLIVGTLLVLSPTLGAQREHHGVLLGAAAGFLFGVSDLAINALSGAIGHFGALGLVSPWLVTCVLASVIAFYASARGFQTGEAVPVITVTSATANVSAIVGGIVVFGDPMASDPLGIAAESLAFLLVIAAAWLTPAPLRHGPSAPQPSTS